MWINVNIKLYKFWTAKETIRALGHEMVVEPPL